MSISAGEMLGLAMIVGSITGVTVGLLVPHLAERFRRRHPHSLLLPAIEAALSAAGP